MDTANVIHMGRTFHLWFPKLQREIPSVLMRTALRLCLYCAVPEVCQDHVRLTFYAESACKQICWQMYGGLWDQNGRVQVAVFVSVKQAG